RILQFIFNLFLDIPCQAVCTEIVQFIRLDHDTYFAPGLYCERFLDAFVALGYGLKFFQTLDTAFKRLAPRTRSGCTECISRCYDDGDDACRFLVTMMGMEGIDDCRMLFIAFCQFNTDIDMAAFDFMVDRLADVMQEPRTSCKLNIYADFT